MERLTRKSDTSDMVWFIDREHKSGYAEREPCDMDSHHSRLAIAKLAQYEDLEQHGKLLKLPCAVGDMVYHVCTFSDGESEIIEMKVCCVEPYGAIRNHKGVCEVWNVYAETDHTKEYFKFFEFGKTVFLTREEAEAALKEIGRVKIMDD